MTHCLALWIKSKLKKPHSHPTPILTFSALAFYLKEGNTFISMSHKKWAECWVGAERGKSDKQTRVLCMKHGHYSRIVPDKHIYQAKASPSNSRWCNITQYALLSVMNYLMGLSGSVSIFFPLQLSMQRFTYQLNWISTAIGWNLLPQFFLSGLKLYNWDGQLLFMANKNKWFSDDIMQITYFFWQFLGSENCV